MSGTNKFKEPDNVIGASQSEPKTQAFVVKEGSSVDAPAVLSPTQVFTEKGNELPVSASAAPKAISPVQSKRQDKKSFPPEFFVQFMILVGLYTISLVFFGFFTAYKLSFHSTLADVLYAEPNVQYLDAKLEYADNFLNSGDTRQYEKARPIYLALVEKLKSIHSTPPQLLAVAKLKLALLDLLTYQQKEAASLAKEVMDNLGEPNKKTPPALVDALRALGQVYVDRDDPYSAWPLISAAGRFWQTGLTKQTEGNTFADLGHLFRQQQDWPLAFKCFEQAYAASSGAGDADFNVYRLGEMASAHAYMGQYKEAIPIFAKAIAMDENVHHGDLYYGANYLSTYVWSLCQLNQLDEANKVMDRYSQLLAKYKKLYSDSYYKDWLQSYENRYRETKQILSDAYAKHRDKTNGRSTNTY